MPERETGKNRDTETRSHMLDHRDDVIAVVVVAEIEIAEVTQDDRALTLQDAGKMELVEHPFDAIGVLAGVFEQQNTAVDRRKVWRSHEMRQHRKVPAPKDPFDVARAGTVEFAFDRVSLRSQQSPTMLQRKRGGCLGTEIVRRHRPGETHHALVRESGQLKRGEIAVAKPPFPGRGDDSEVYPVE